MLTIGYSSCDFLDIVPDEITTEADAFKDRNAAKNFVYSCYGYLPQSNVASGSLDLLTGDEVITAFEHETFASFPKGNYTASSPVISYWNTFFQGLRQCYIFLENVDKVPDLTESVKTDYIAQVKFLIAYYHYQLARCYGPIILIKELPDVNASQAEYLPRTSYDECVDWICNLLDEAASSLPAIRTNKEDYGLATSVGAKAVKAKMLLYAASPLFNGNSSFYSNFTDKSGSQLMPLTYDPNKWVKAKTAIKEAIDLAEQNGHALYVKQDYKIGNEDANPYPAAGPVRCLRTSLVDWDSRNPEVLLAETRSEGSYGIQNKSLPFVTDGWAWNGVGPTWTMLNRFYTKNGLPWDEDPEYKDKDKLKIVNVDASHADEAHEGSKTLLFNLDREPRFYAWVAFQGGYYEVMNGSTNPAYVMSNGKKDNSDSRLICDFVLGGNCSRGTATVQRPGNYTPSGYLNKKGVDPNTVVSTNATRLNQYPWPIIRLADLYLAYAEACVETNDLETAKQYLNKVRERAGIPTVETAWSGVAALDQTKLRQIVRQERMNELYLENQNFWDMRRWLLAGQYFNVKAKGLNIAATTIEDYAIVKTIDFERKFEAPTQYLLPIPSADINRNEKLVNNPGY